MRCNNCGAILPEEAQFCSNCGNKILNPNIQSQPVVNDYSSNPYQSMQERNNQAVQETQEIPPYKDGNAPLIGTEGNDEKSIGLNVLSWFVPLVGIILYFVNKDEKPIQSKSVLHCAIASIIVNVILVLIFIIAITCGIFGAFGALSDCVY